MLPYWLAAMHLPNIGPRTVLRWLEIFPNIQSVFNASTEELSASGILLKHIKHIQQPDWPAVEKALQWVNAMQHIITLDAPDYPYLLKEIHDPPLVLFVHGDKGVLNSSQLAVVGSRHATPAGLDHANRFARCLAENGLTITSGLAQGIDANAHKGALAVCGKTIAVAGTGLHHTYPVSHRALRDEIVQNQGAIISEFPLTTPPCSSNFPRRNRIIAGLSRGVLVIEAALKSGSLITARHALESGREVFAIPGSIHNPLARGCHHLIRQGAKLVESAADILEEFGSHFAVPTTPNALITSNLLPEQAELVEKIEYEITPFDVILSRSGLTPAEVSSMLLSLELYGHVKSAPGGFIRLVP